MACYPKSSSTSIKALATIVFLLVLAALFLAIKNRSVKKTKFLHAKQSDDDNPFLILPHGSVTIKPERLPPPTNSADIYISVLTAPVYHDSRFALQYLTWLQTVDTRNVRVITDNDDNKWLRAFKSEGGTVVMPNCRLTKLVKSAEMMCCKTGAQFDYWYQAREAGNKYNWYCHVDDDLYLNIQVLVDALKPFDPSKDCYVGAWGAVERYHKMKRIPGTYKLAPKLAAYSERKRNDFRYASGPSYCISEALMMKVEKYLRGRNYEYHCKKSGASMDDILPGVIIDGVLGIDLNVTDEFKGQLDDIVLYHSNEPGDPNKKDTKKEITVSFNGFVIKSGVFSHLDDPKGVLSYHCLLHPTVSWCQRRNSHQL